MKEDLLAYSFWARDQLNKRDKKENEPISRSTLLDMIATMNCTTNTHCTMLLDTIGRTTVPWIPIGTGEEGVPHRLAPGAGRGLLPDREAPDIKERILNDDILGVNTNVQPATPMHLESRRKRRLSQMSSDLNADVDCKDGGFVFHQLGPLEYWSGNNDLKVLQNPNLAKEGMWMPTRFYVVIRFSSDGTPGGIYIVYDFYPEDGGGNRDRKIEHDEWGYLHGLEFEDPFSIAKIADDIKELSFDRRLNLTELRDYPVEIVEAVWTSHGTVVRVTVALESRFW